MFDIFRMMTISGYIRKASRYIKSTYVFENNSHNQVDSVDSECGVKYSSRDIKESDDLKSCPQDEEELFKLLFKDDENQADNANRRESLPHTTQASDRYIRYDLGDIDDQYDQAQITAAMKRYSFLDESITLFEALDKATNKTFVDALMIHMRRQNLQPASLYKVAHIDRKLFSKIVSDRNYKPSKDTAIALILALNLNLDEANDMLERAGYTFSHSSKRDIIIEYFIREKIYNINDINEVLYKLDQKVIGK